MTRFPRDLKRQPFRANLMARLAADWITPAVVGDGRVQAVAPAPAVAAYIDQVGSPPSQAVGQAVTDRVFRVPVQQLAAVKAAAGGSAFTYDFRWTATGGRLPGLAFHCLEVPFFFDALAEPGVTEAMVPGAAPGTGHLHVRRTGPLRHRRRRRLGQF